MDIFRAHALHPVRSFDSLPRGGFGRPIVFSLCAVGLGSVIGALLYAAVSLSVGWEALGGLWADPVFFTMYHVAATTVLLLAPLAQCMAAAVLSLFLLPWAPEAGFRQTYRALLYAQGAPLFLFLCLEYSIVVALPWLLVLTVIAQSRVHRIAWWKAALSVSATIILGLFLVGMVS